MITVGLTGADVIKTRFKILAGKVDSRQMESRMVAAADVITEKARQKAPLGKTGNLRRGIRSGRFRKKRIGQPAAFSAIDYRIAPHAHLVEYGTRFAAAKPFFRPAVDSSRGEVAAIIKSGVRSMIRQGGR